MTDTLEKGRITFLYEPAAGKEEADKLVDVYHFYALMRPDEGSRVRRLVVGQKKLPPQDATGHNEGRYWGFVDAVQDAEGAFESWKRKGEGTPPDEPPHTVAEGTYAIARDDEGGTRLEYALERPEDLTREQRMFHLDDEGAFVLSIKNPEAGAPAGAGLEPDRRAEYPDDLAKEFGDRRWVAADPPRFLDHEGAEFLLIATGETGA